MLSAPKFVKCSVPHVSSKRGTAFYSYTAVLFYDSSKNTGSVTER